MAEIAGVVKRHSIYLLSQTHILCGNIFAPNSAKVCQATHREVPWHAILHKKKSVKKLKQRCFLQKYFSTQKKIQIILQFSFSLKLLLLNSLRCLLCTSEMFCQPETMMFPDTDHCNCLEVFGVFGCFFPSKRDRIV